LSDNLLLNLTFLKSNCIQPYFIKDPSIYSLSLSLSLCLSLFFSSPLSLFISHLLSALSFLSFYISFTLFLSIRHTLILSICFFFFAIFSPSQTGFKPRPFSFENGCFSDYAITASLRIVLFQAYILTNEQKLFKGPKISWTSAIKLLTKLILCYKLVRQQALKSNIVLQRRELDQLCWNWLQTRSQILD